MPQQQIKQQQQQRTTQKNNWNTKILLITVRVHVHVSPDTSIKEENKSNRQTLLYHKTKACPLTAVFPLNVQLLKIAEPPLIKTAPPYLLMSAIKSTIVGRKKNGQGCKNIEPFQHF